MPNSHRPWLAQVDLESGVLWPTATVITCRLSDMRGAYHDSDAEERLIAESDPLIYRVDELTVPEEDGQLLTSVTTLYPGMVGDEYFMSRGHFHVREECVKVYLCLRGEGQLLLRKRNGESAAMAMKRGSAVYAPPYWGQRTVNTGDEPFVYYKVWPATSGHDYESIRTDSQGFIQRVVSRDGQPTLVPTQAPA